MKKILLIAFFALIIIGGLVFYYNPSSARPFIQIAKEPAAETTFTQAFNFSPAVEEKKITTLETRSPDGSMKLTMQKTKNTDSSTIYSFIVAGPQTPSVEIYTKTLTAGAMSVPLNAWAPDNKHFFIAEDDGVLENYLVFKATGQAFEEGAPYIDFRAHYNKKMTEFSLRDVTGWDAPDLLHVRTSGPAYWFELGSNAFYRLVQR